MTQDITKYFRIEGAQLLERIGQALLELDKGNDPQQQVAALLRHVHTLKGAARVVKVTAVAEVAHAMEDVMAPFRHATDPLPREVIDRLLADVDVMEAHLRALTAEVAVDVPDAPGVKDARAAPGVPAANLGADAQRGDLTQLSRPDLSEVDALLEQVEGVTATLSGADAAFAELAALRSWLDVLGRRLSAPSREGRDGPRATHELLALTRRMEELSRGVERAFRDHVDHVERGLGEVRTAAEALRLAPVERVAASLERAVRDAARAQGKDVSLSLTGGDVRLDVNVLFAMREALVQLVTNAVVHGVELPDERGRAGKPKAGQIRLEVTRAGSRVVFACHDDGRGLNVEAVRSRLQARGVKLAVDDDNLAELLQWLPRAGISTASAVTDSAGRGVGLDVVREVAARLLGELRVQTWAGRGFRVELDVPVSVAAFEALSVEAAEVSVMLPMDAIVRCERFEQDSLTQQPEGAVVTHEGRLIPFYPLAALWTQDVSRHEHSRALLVVRAEDELVALGVERIQGTRPITMRPLPVSAVVQPAIAGVTLDSTGKPMLVIDPMGISQQARAYRRGAAGRGFGVPKREVPRVLVVDDSLTTRMMEQSILESAGYHVDLAVSAEDALQRVKQQSYSLFLVDVEMPGMDGFTFVAQTRADADLRRTPAVLVSSRSDPEDLERGRAAGAAGYVIKSRFDQRELLALIERLIAT